MSSRTARVVVHPDKQALADGSAARLITAVLDVQNSKDVVHVVLTGGSMGSEILRSVAACAARGAVDWNRVHLWWGDERCLPEGDDERNEKQCLEALRAGVDVPEANIHAVAPTDTPAGETAEKAAEDYAAQLAAHAPDGAAAPEFDVLILGVGPDGHVASLFPGHPAQLTTGRVAVAVHDSPKPPPDRVSLTFECLNHSSRVWFLVAGADKAGAVRDGVTGAGPERSSAAQVSGSAETLWLVDADAASELGQLASTG